MEQPKLVVKKEYDDIYHKDVYNLYVNNDVIGFIMRIERRDKKHYGLDYSENFYFSEHPRYFKEYIKGFVSSHAVTKKEIIKAIERELQKQYRKENPVDNSKEIAGLKLLLADAETSTEKGELQAAIQRLQKQQ